MVLPEPDSHPGNRRFDRRGFVESAVSALDEKSTIVRPVRGRCCRPKCIARLQLPADICELVPDYSVHSVCWRGSVSFLWRRDDEHVRRGEQRDGDGPGEEPGQGGACRRGDAREVLLHQRAPRHGDRGPGSHALPDVGRAAEVGRTVEDAEQAEYPRREREPVGERGFLLDHRRRCRCRARACSADRWLSPFVRPRHMPL